MKLLEDRIAKESKIINNEIIKVDSFLNHQIDPILIDALAEDILAHFSGTKIDKVLTVETSGIAIAYAVARLIKKPFVYAKKSKSMTVGNDVYTTIVKSFTRKTVNNVTVCKDYLNKDEKILLIDDFLAEGNAAFGMIDLCKQAGAKVIGLGVAIEKGFQMGRKKLEDVGVPVYSGAIIKAFKNNKAVF